MRLIKITPLVIFLLLGLGCSAQRSSINTTTIVDGKEVPVLPIRANSQLIMRKDYDLKGQTYVLPEGVMILAKNGVFKNGTLIGNKTSISGNGPLFQRVTIKGNWNVPKISTSLFKDLTYENSLQDVLALSSPDIDNSILIGVGDYYVSTKSTFGTALLVKSNTVITLEGTIHLLPNNLRGCYVINVKGANNVTIKGSGSVIGDRLSHTGTIGEWGHGINLDSSTNVKISGINVSNCWGDCIYVGTNSSDVVIEGCNLSRGRRQGISITSGKRIRISNCDITEISGTPPQFAIDVEPNKDLFVDDVLIENVRVSNCFGGFLSFGGASGASIGTITLRNCSLRGTSAPRPVRFAVGKRVYIEDCDFDTGDSPGIFTDVVDNVVLRNNVIRSSNRNAITIRREKGKRTENNSVIKK